MFFNYYYQAIYNTIQTSVSTIASSLLTSSWKYLKFRINQFLYYAATHPNAKIRYHSIQIHLWIHSGASYLNEYKYHSCNVGFLYLSDKPKLPMKSNGPPPKLNAPVLVNSKITDTVISSVQESETGSGFINGKNYVPPSQLPTCNGPHPRSNTNSIWQKIANVIINGTALQRISKAMDMLFYWLCIQCWKIISYSLETRKTQSYQIYIKTSFHKTSYLSSADLCTQYHPKTNKIYI